MRTRKIMNAPARFEDRMRAIQSLTTTRDVVFGELHRIGSIVKVAHIDFGHRIGLKGARDRDAGDRPAVVDDQGRLWLLDGSGEVA